ncbi:MlaD family protein [Salipiger sp. 1_MG-2023]|uniref:MlaD family protein n=1 Tax=Salipiger sp. 1_MG-2023 TaxID=3062665 RepID=UPI0026E1729A|nr:MlaD family protein [Salipiger sp. 1_MG-2023]MDO6585706.1 MlaD family protein [Salipiger sp. 1_MG-2023]
METKANFVLIGAVTLAGLLGMMGLLVWFAKIEIDRQYAVYEVLFDDASGLGMAADVRYNGLAVGKVIGLDLDQSDPSKVRVQIEVAATTPIKTDTTAQLNSLGVTGVGFVALTGGSAEAPLLRDTEDPNAVKLIESERSVVQALSEDAPDLVAEAVAAIREVRNFLGAENQQSVANVLNNLESASGQLETALSDFSDISRTVSDGVGEITKFTGRLDVIGTSVETALVSITETLDVAKLAIASVEPTFRSASEAFTTAEATIDDVDTFVQTRVPQIADDLTAAIRSVETATAELQPQLEEVLAQFGGTATAATQRFDELEATIAGLDATLAEAQASFGAIETASGAFQLLVSGEGTALVTDARATLTSVNEAVASVDRMLKDDIPPIVADIRSAVSSASGVIDTVSADVSAFTNSLDPLAASGEETLKAATQTLQNADRTLANLDRALTTTETTLETAEGAFAKADTVLSTDLGPAVADIRTAAGQVETTMSSLAADIPAITTDLRAAAARTLSLVENIEATVAASAPPVQAFARDGLPEFTRFALEAQQLVTRLEQVAKKLERDPARFFFGNSLPEFRR